MIGKKMLAKIERFFTHNFPTLTFLFDKNLRATTKIIKVGRQNLEVLFPPRYTKKEFLAKYPAYDKFVAKIAQSIEEDTLIIDVGANVGDSIFDMVELGSRHRFIAVEGSLYFLQFLRRNCESLRTAGVEVQVVPTFLGSKHGHVKLVGNHSSARLV
jgi:hypothetical protein